MGEAEAVRLSNDLLRGNNTEASEILLYELMQPNAAMAREDLHRATYLAGINSPLEIVQKPNGQIEIAKREYNHDDPFADSRKSGGVDFDLNAAHKSMQSTNETRPATGLDQYRGPQNFNQPLSREVAELANDLAIHNRTDALKMIGKIEKENPQQAARDFDAADRLADSEAAMYQRSRPDHVVEGRFGRATLIDEYGKPVAQTGNIGNRNRYSGYPGALPPQNYLAMQNPYNFSGYPYDNGCYATPTYNSESLVVPILRGLLGGHRHHW